MRSFYQAKEDRTQLVLLLAIGFLTLAVIIVKNKCTAKINAK